MEGSAKKLLEDKLIASMKTEITLLKKLKHLALHRSDKEGGCKSSWCSSAQHNGTSYLATAPRLNGMGTHADKFRRAGGSSCCGNT